MKKLVLPREKAEYVPSGIYSYSKEKRKDVFLKMFSQNEKDDIINNRRIENLKELRGDYH